MAKFGRNKPCHCGSGKKYKHCHGSIATTEAPKIKPDVIQNLVRRHEAAERIRESQQGRGRPIISMKMHDRQVVAVGNTIHRSNKWKTFTDFLLYYIVKALDPEWGNAEIKKPLAERHPIMQWYDAFCGYQAKTITVPGQVSSAQVTGVVACYLGLAYSLYLIAHNVELQDRLIRRLKDPSNFQGAYYELFVANVLIRAGFALVLEDETDPHSKHCEFQAVSKRTGKRYSVEAKMRSVNGLLGRSELDGGKDGQCLARLGQHVNKSLDKPAVGERLVFVDINGPQTLNDAGKPVWVEPAMRRLERLEREDLPEGVTAYVFVTNIAFHRQLDAIASSAMAPFGLGMPEFARPGPVRIVDAYEAKQKHVDAFEIGDAFGKYTAFPVTFDGSFASDAFDATQGRILIGETYDFDGLIGTVTTASVFEQGKEILISVTCADGKSHILKGPMTDAQLEDYRTCPEAYFGQIIPVSQQSADVLELFEFVMKTYRKTPKEKLVEWMSKVFDRAKLEEMPQEDLAKLYCEGIVGSIQSREADRGSIDSDDI